MGVQLVPIEMPIVCGKTCLHYKYVVNQNLGILTVSDSENFFVESKCFFFLQKQICPQTSHDRLCSIGYTYIVYDRQVFLFFYSGKLWFYHPSIIDKGRISIHDNYNIYLIQMYIQKTDNRQFVIYTCCNHISPGNVLVRWLTSGFPFH